MQDWAEACTIPELNSLFRSDSDSNNFTQMENDSEIDEKQSDTASDNDVKSDWLTKLRKNQTVLIIAAAVLLLFIITCPSKDSHKEAIVNEMNEAIDGKGLWKAVFLKMKVWAVWLCLAKHLSVKCLMQPLIPTTGQQLRYLFSW